jgi:hypothetical protein
MKERTIAIRSDNSAMSEILAFIKYDKADVEDEVMFWNSLRLSPKPLSPSLPPKK